MDVSRNEHNHDDFLEAFPLSSFLQSRFWKHFLNLQGKKTWQLNVYKDRRMVAHCVLYSNELPFGKSYLYAPKGPLILPTLSEDERKEALGLILSQIRDITIATRKREEIFCRIESNLDPVPIVSTNLKKVAPIQPQTTIYLELNSTPDSHLALFKEKTRYNIRLARKKGVTVHWSQGLDGMKIFLRLMSKSANRNKIRTHDKKYFMLMLEANKGHDALHINWAEYEKRPVAANIYIMQYPTMTYVHGGFDYRYRNVMAPYLLQWEAIQFAYQHKIPYYDFWGYTPADGTKPSWAGFSKFKEGFSGTIVETPGTYDVIYNTVWYNLYTKFKKISSG